MTTRNSPLKVQSMYYDFVREVEQDTTATDTEVKPIFIRTVGNLLAYELEGEGTWKGARRVSVHVILHPASETSKRISTLPTRLGQNSAL